MTTSSFIDTVDTCRSLLPTHDYWRWSIPHWSGKNVAQSAAGSDVITNTVIT